MNTFKFVSLAMIAVAATAIAQTPPLAAAHGRGVVQNQGGGKAEFGFEVAKRMVDGTVRVRGNLNFATMPGEGGDGGRTRPVVRISTDRLERLVIAEDNPKAGSFGGPAVLARIGANGNVERIQGVVSVNVADNRNPDSDPTVRKDGFRIQFNVRGEGGTPRTIFTFAGAVVRGDLVVRSTSN